MKQHFLHYLLITIFPGKHTLNVLSSACYAVRSVKPYVTINTAKMIYYSYFHSVIDLLFVVLGELPQQYKDFQVANEDY